MWKRIIDSPRERARIKETACIAQPKELFNQNAPCSGEDHYFSLFISKAGIASRMTNTDRSVCLFIFSGPLHPYLSGACEGGLQKLFIYAHNWGEKHSIAPAFSITDK